MLAGVNDQQEQAHQLGQLLQVGSPGPIKQDQLAASLHHVVTC